MDNRWSDLGRPPLNQRALRAALTEGLGAAWRELEVVTETGSTNTDLAQRARAGAAAGMVLVAEAQSAGRGRRGRDWTAPPRSSLTFSVLLRPSAPSGTWPWLGMLAALAVSDALRQDCGLDAWLKWPNDVLVPPGPGADLRKVAGLLSEVVSSPDGAAVVVGAGINVSQDDDELPAGTATSLRLAGSARTGRDPILRSVLRHLARRYAAWEAAGGDPRAGLAAAYRERCDTIGRMIRVQLPPDGSQSIEGVAEGVDDAGRLMLRPDGQDKGAITPLSVGDVVHIRTSERA